MNYIITFAIAFAIFVGLIVIHEIGHFLVGYLLGIPKNCMSIQLMGNDGKKGFGDFLKINPHVALVDKSGTKVPPSEIDRYVELLENYLPSEKRMFCYVAGGHAFEFITVLGLAAIALISNMSILLTLAAKTALISLILSVIYLVSDVLSTFCRKKLSGGDFSGQWEISPFMSVVFYFIYFTGLAYIWILVS